MGRLMMLHFLQQISRLVATEDTIELFIGKKC